MSKSCPARAPSRSLGSWTLSDDLANTNWQRFQEWDPHPDPKTARQAIFAFKGDTYLGLDVGRFGTRDLTASQRRIRILSGLYGVLRPLDLIQPHRLEMGTRLVTERGNNLYQFWGDQITQTLAADLDDVRPQALVNLASHEYFKSVVATDIAARVITPRFEDFSNGQYRVVGFFAKRARGAMAAWIVLNRITTLKGLTSFDDLGYRYSRERSSRNQPTFIRNLTA